MITCLHKATYAHVSSSQTCSKLIPNHLCGCLQLYKVFPLTDIQCCGVECSWKMCSSCDVFHDLFNKTFQQLGFCLSVFIENGEKSHARLLGVKIIYVM